MVRWQLPTTSRRPSHELQPPRPVGALALTLATSAAQAQLAITEVAPWSSGNSPVAADWFEVTNFGTTAIDYQRVEGR